MSFETMLVHADDNPHCRQQLDVGVWFALDFGAKLVGIYVVATAELTPSFAALVLADVGARRLRDGKARAAGNRSVVKSQGRRCGP